MTAASELAEALRERGFAVTHAVRLVDYGAHKIAAIKAVRELTNWGLKQAKDAVEACATILDSVSLDAAQHASVKLREAGSTVEIGVGEVYLYAFAPDDPRRGEQLIERLRVVGFSLALERGRLGAWTSAPLRPLTLAPLLAEIDEQRETWARAGKHESTSELAILERVSARDRTFEERLRASDDTARAREAHVYGDWLQTQGDLRGLVAAAALAVAEAGAAVDVRDQRYLELDRLVFDHLSHLFGPSRALMQAATWTWLGPVLDTLTLQTEDPQPMACERLAELLTAPVCACLRSLALARPIEADLVLGEVLAAAACAPGLRELRIEHAMNVTLRGHAFARLETLAINGRLTIGPATLPALRTLELSVAVPFAPLVASFVQLDTPALEHFSLWVATYEYWLQNYGPLQTNLVEVLSLPSFAKLRTLKLAGGPLLAGFAGLLARIPAIGTLERIDLRGANMNTECRVELARNRERLPGLQL